MRLRFCSLGCSDDAGGSTATQFEITCDATELRRSGDTVTFSWSGVASPATYDWIGLWAADNSTMFAWFYAYESVTYHRLQSKWPGKVKPPLRGLSSQLSNEQDNSDGADMSSSGGSTPIGPDVLSFHSNYATGAGTVALRLYNLRLPGFKLVYYPQSSPEPDDAPLGSSPVVTFTQGVEEPTQIHVVLTAHPGEMRVMWVSGSSTTPSVTFGLSADSLTNTVSGTVSTYNRSALCHQPQYEWTWLAPGWIADVVVDCYGAGYSAGTQVFYAVGAGDTFSDVFSFLVPATPGSNRDAAFSWIMVREAAGVVATFGDGPVKCFERPFLTVRGHGNGGRVWLPAMSDSTKGQSRTGCDSSHRTNCST